jgi:hypothetical protein
MGWPMLAPVEKKWRTLVRIAFAFSNAA